MVLYFIGRVLTKKLNLLLRFTEFSTLASTDESHIIVLLENGDDTVPDRETQKDLQVEFLKAEM